ncbi:MAG: glycosyltransferase family 2 protein, partial [Candidatus Hydrogenedentes bacterium]|nr:glycosyltransferase family 2 protein [Candidatus Hydrogenedentota bacterium]
MPDVSVIIVTWNSAPYIGACLESILTHSGIHTLEIIVADNGSTDDTCERISSGFPDVILLRWGANLGFPKANNLAAKRAHGKYLFFLNPDTYLDNNAVESLRSHLEANPSLGIVGPGILSEKGNSIAVDARSFPSLRGTLFRYFGLRSLLPHHPLFGSEYLHPAKRDTPQSVECLTGAALFMEAEFFRSLDGFDEQLPMYFEDMDL